MGLLPSLPFIPALWGLQFYSAKVLLQMSSSGSFCSSPYARGDGVSPTSDAQGRDFYSVSFRPVNPGTVYVPFLVRLVSLTNASAPHALGHGVSPMLNAQV